MYQRQLGIPQILVMPMTTLSADAHIIPLKDPICSLSPGINMNYETDVVRFSCSSLLVPEQVFEYSLNSKKLTLLREELIKGNTQMLHADSITGSFDASSYVCIRVMVQLEGAASPAVPLTLYIPSCLRLTVSEYTNVD